jgi:hypothetical protein
VPGFGSFKLVVTPLQSGAVGPYLIWGIRFPSHLLLEETRSCQNLLGRNQWPAVPEVLDPNSSPELSVERVAGLVHLTEGRIGTHLKLRVLLRDSEVRPWG